MNKTFKAVPKVVVLLLGPLGSLRLLGLPEASDFFYSSVLGAVLVGSGLALLLSERGLAGLGLPGAIVTNLCGALAVVARLIAVPEHGSPAGRALLWIIAVWS